MLFFVEVVSRNESMLTSGLVLKDSSPEILIRKITSSRQSVGNRLFQKHRNHHSQ